MLKKILIENLLLNDLSNIERIAFFDFDGTLVNSPEPEEGKIIYKQKTGKDYRCIKYRNLYFED